MRPDTDYRLTEEARHLLRGIGEAELGRSVIVCWNRRMRREAGRAWLQELRVDLHPGLKVVEGAQTEVDRTLRHELAHLVAQHRAGERYIPPHGAEWKQACCELGIPGEKATHNLPLGGAGREKRYAYRCPKCGVTLRRARKMTRQCACLKCCREWNEGEFCEDFVFELVEQVES